MATNYGDTVNAIYLAYYGRPADPAGLAFWTESLQKTNGDLNAIVNAFATSPEATVRFASVSVTDRVTDIYQQLFNRAPDKAGLDYWVEAIESGRLSIANAALEIMHGAVSTDAQISTVRQQVAAQFTAEVEKSGIAYDGIAAVEAARVVISAVTADSKPADIDALVKAGSSLVQTAHDNPAIITALANGGDLSKVLSTDSGKADPVGMVQALASIGKAALTDSAGLEALLQGGGVSGLLGSLPSGTSLADVAAAVKEGGLAAGADVAKPPPADTTPPPAATVQLAQDTGVSSTDHITSNGKIQIKGIESGAAWQYSADAGKTWTTGAAADANGAATLDTTANGEQTLQVRVVDAAGNIGAVTSFQYVLRTSLAPTMIFTVDGKEMPGLDTLSVNSINYLVHIFGTTKGSVFDFQVSDSGKDGSWTTVKDTDPLSEGVHYIRYVATDLAGNVGATNALKLVWDQTPPSAPKVELVNDSGISPTDHFTNDGHIKVSGLEANGSWEYSLDAGQTWTSGPAANADGIAILETTVNGPQSLQVRSHDLARNTSEVVKFDYTLQSSFNPTLAFRDGANGADLPGTTLLTNTDDFWITLHGGLDAAKVVFQVSDSGQDGTWANADMSAPFSDGTHYIRDIVTDRAGNTSVTNALRVDMDKTAPGAPKVALVQDTGTSATDGLTTWPEYRVSGIEAGASWEYSLDAGATWLKGAAPDANGVATGVLPTSGDQTLLFRATDKAGNVSATATLHANYDNVVPAENLAFDHITGGAKGVSETTLTKVDAVYTYTGTLKAGAVVEYSFGGGIWTKIDASMIDTAARTITIKDIDLSAGDKYVDLHVSDAAGWTTMTGYQFIDGPVTKFTTEVTDSGIVIYSDQGANAYLTSNGTPARILSAETGGIIVSDVGTAVGVQASGVSGVLGVGRSAAVHSDSDVAYGLGSNGNDTLTGKFVWGYAGNDDITTVGSGGTVIGGAGADTIHVNAGSSKLVIHGVSESQVVADATAAHGFDTVTTNPAGLGSATITLSFAFDAAIKDGYQAVTAASYTGAETGVELLALLNGAVGSSFQASGNGQAMVVKTGGDASFLVVDANGDAKIDAADYVVKIVGSLDTSGMSFGAGTVYIPVPVA